MTTPADDGIAAVKRDDAAAAGTADKIKDVERLAEHAWEKKREAGAVYTAQAWQQERTQALTDFSELLRSRLAFTAEAGNVRTDLDDPTAIWIEGEGYRLELWQPANTREAQLFITYGACEHCKEPRGVAIYGLEDFGEFLAGDRRDNSHDRCATLATLQTDVAKLPSADELLIKALEDFVHEIKAGDR